MSWRTFAQDVARLLGLAEPVRTQPVDPVQAAYQDAYALLSAIYAGHPFSRRAWDGKFGQARWQRATDLLRMAGILNRKGRYVFDHDRDWETACSDLLAVANAEQERRSHKTFVAARKG